MFVGIVVFAANGRWILSLRAGVTKILEYIRVVCDMLVDFVYYASLFSPGTFGRMFCTGKQTLSGCTLAFSKMNLFGL